MLSGFTFGFSKWRDSIQSQKSRSEMVRKIDLEIGSRVSELTELMKPTFTHTVLFTARAAVIGESESDPEVGKLDRFSPGFPEFRGRSLTSLLWELKGSASPDRSAAIDLAFQASRKLSSFIEDQNLGMLQERGATDSIWRFKQGMSDRYEKEILSAFRQPEWNW